MNPNDDFVRGLIAVLFTLPINSLAIDPAALCAHACRPFNHLSLNKISRSHRPPETRTLQETWHVTSLRHPIFFIRFSDLLVRSGEGSEFQPLSRCFDTRPLLLLFDLWDEDDPNKRLEAGYSTMVCCETWWILLDPCHEVYSMS